MSANDKDVNSSGKSDNEKANLARKQSSPLSLQAWDDIIGQRIAQAMKDGEFDNLPGKGKPQKLDNNHFAGDNQMAFDIMQNNDISPGWIGRRKELTERIDRLRADIRRKAGQHRHELSHTLSAIEKANINRQWSALIVVWQKEVSDLNEQIQSLNIEQPLQSMEILKVRLGEEMTKVGFEHDVD